MLPMCRDVHSYYHARDPASTGFRTCERLSMDAKPDPLVAIRRLEGCQILEARGSLIEEERHDA